MKCLTKNSADVCTVQEKRVFKRHATKDAKAAKEIGEKQVYVIARKLENVNATHV